MEVKYISETLLNQSTSVEEELKKNLTPRFSRRNGFHLRTSINRCVLES